MKTEIMPSNDGIAIKVDDAGSHAEELLSAFKECQAGTCSCPTNEYEKVESMCIEQSDNGISLTVKVKQGQQLDQSEIEKCLDHTTRNIK